MQTACIEFARNVVGLRDADSTEFNEETPFPIIFKLRDLVNVDELGGTMRLGNWPCRTKEGSLVSVAGGGDTVAALNHAGVAQDFTFVSTAGGAFLEWMEGKVLPGVAALTR